MATFLLHLCIWSSYSSTHWPDFPWRLHVLRCEETQASRGSRGCLVSSESQQKRACGENHMSMWQLTQLSFFYDRISKSIISVHLLTHECMGEVWRVQEKRNTWLYCVSIIVGAQRHVFQYKTVRKECQQLWFRMGDSRKYPYHTTDGFHVLNPPCLRKFQNALPPHALRIP